jgi:two-component system phosphate regulon sensor histidine kinase PhoR
MTAVTAIAASNSIKSFYYKNRCCELKEKAGVLKPHFTDNLKNEQKVDSLCKELGPVADVRITVLKIEGNVIGDSLEDPKMMENHAFRPEFQTALNGKTGKDIRYSNTLREEMIYTAVPVMNENGGITGILSVSVSAASLEKELLNFYLIIIITGIAGTIAGCIFAVWFSGKIIAPIEKLKAGIESFSRGNFNNNLKINGFYETSILAEIINKIAGQLEERMRTIERQNTLEKAILSGMAEGVIAVDKNMRILILNNAAGKLFNLEEQYIHDMYGRRIEEIIRTGSFLEFLAKVLNSDTVISEDLTLYSKTEKNIEVLGNS